MVKQLELPFPPEEEWRDAPGWEGIYQVANTGLIRGQYRYDKSVYNTLKPALVHGYLRINLKRDGRRKSYAIHRLVMLAFVGECPPGMEVNHKNGIRHDNRLENLEYVTPVENVQHAIHVLGDANRPRGERIGNAKLTEKQVREIRTLYIPGVIGIHRLAHRYGVTARAITLIIKRESWKHVE